MKTTERKSNAILIIGAFAILVILAVALGLLAFAGTASRNTVNIWASIATLLIVPVFFFGFYLGKIEARGLLSGFDKSLDRITNVLGQVVTMRDQSRIGVHNATRQPGYTVVLPNVTQPTIAHRQLSIGDDNTEDL